MISEILLFAVLSSGAVLGNIILKKKYRFEEYVPVSCMVLVLWLFGFGLVGALKAGMISLLVLCTGIWIAGIAAAIRNRDLLKGFFTPGFFAFAALFAVTTFVCYGQMAHVLDEFSHWALVVKEMFLTNRLSLSPEVRFTFYKHYPPAMPIFQFFFLKLGGSFDEWKMYFAYQVFMLSFFMPFLKYLNFRKPQAYLAIAAMWLAAMVFFPTVYMEIYIDPFLAAVMGCGFASILTEKNDTSLYRVNVLLSASILVLSKEVGLLLGIFLILAYIIRTKTWKACWAFAFAAVPEILWKTGLKLFNVIRPDSGKIDIGSFIRVITGAESAAHSYRPQVFHAFFTMLAGKSEAGVPYWLAFLILFIWFFSITYYQKKKYVFTCMLAGTAVYVFGMLLTYMYLFVPGEGLAMASFSRYIGVVLSAVLISAVLATIAAKENNFRNIVLTLAIVLVSIQYSQLWQYMNRHAVGYGIQTRSYAESWCEDLRKQYPSGSRICYGTGETATTEFFETRYILAPEYDVYWETK